MKKVVFKASALISILTVVIFLGSCTSNEIGNSKDVNPEAIYFDYKIWSEAGAENVTVNLQYRMGGPNGTTLVLSEPSKVMLDGEVLKVDSGSLSGAYYEIQKPLESFTGNHTILFKDLNGKEYKEEFTFKPISLVGGFPSNVNRKDLIATLQGLEPVDVVRILLTDTTYSGNNINDRDTVRNGLVKISKTRLDSLVNGPVELQVYKEQELSLKNTAREGGKLFITYGLKREFVLKD
jgi:hypothetical protein